MSVEDSLDKMKWNQAQVRKSGSQYFFIWFRTARFFYPTYDRRACSRSIGLLHSAFKRGFGLCEIFALCADQYPSTRPTRKECDALDGLVRCPSPTPPWFWFGLTARESVSTLWSEMTQFAFFSTSWNNVFCLTSPATSYTAHDDIQSLFAGDEAWFFPRSHLFLYGSWIEMTCWRERDRQLRK